MIYADTNVLLSLFCPDSLTAAAVAWYQKIGDPVCISSWTVIEYRANMGLRVRKGLMPRGDVGTVVLVHQNGEGFEVEFTTLSR